MKNQCLHFTILVKTKCSYFNSIILLTKKKKSIKIQIMCRNLGLSLNIKLAIIGT